jgi:hypothetical protein
MSPHETGEGPRRESTLLVVCAQVLIDLLVLELLRHAVVGAARRDRPEYERAA